MRCLLDNQFHEVQSVFNFSPPPNLKKVSISEYQQIFEKVHKKSRSNITYHLFNVNCCLIPDPAHPCAGNIHKELQNISQGFSLRIIKENHKFLIDFHLGNSLNLKNKPNQY